MTSNSEQKTIVRANPYLELNNQGQILQLELHGNEHRLGRDRSFADLIVPPEWQVISRCHAVLRRKGEDYYIYDGDGQKPSSNGLFLDRSRITPTEGYSLTNGSQIRIGQDPRNQIFLTYINPLSNITASAPTVRSISLQNRSVLLGRDPSANLQLDSPIVSRRHAIIEPSGLGKYILRDYSTNGIFVNGQRVQGGTLLADGSTIRIGPFTLLLRGDILEVPDQGNQIRLDTKDLVIKGRLDNITLAIEPGQFVALVGGSGAGKSTLMKTLLGIEKTNSGIVYLNGDNLRKNFNIYRTQIGYVPQDDIIHQDLKVTEVLKYAAKLRLPPDMSNGDIDRAVIQTLEDIGMSHKKDSLVKDLSGGQRKRVSIGVELLAQPKLFFLDEPTSGLDPGRDLMMMELMRNLANQGRTVILVTHATANITLCDRVAFLGRGGRLCYFGPPQEAFNFFEEKDNFAKIYIKLEPDVEKVKNETEAIAQTYANKFRNSHYYQQYIENHLSQPENQPESVTKNPANTSPSPTQVKPSFFKQLSILCQRYLQLVWRDKTNLGLSLLTAPIGVSLITLALKENPLIPADPLDAKTAPLALRVLFVFTCAALWVGLSSSVQEIVKEAAIYTRERLVNLGLFAYLGSKFVILGSLAVLQTILISAVILLCFKSPTPEIIPWFLGVGITTFLTLVTSFSLGLMISGIAKNGSQANSTLPLILLPQIIFSGVLFRMEGFASKISWLMLSRWSIGAYGSLVNVNAMNPEPTKLPDGSIIELPFKATPVYDPTWENLSLNWGVLCLHTFIYLAVTWILQKRKDIF